MSPSSAANQKKNPSSGQVLPLFALSLVVLLGLVGLGLDAAQAFVERRDAQGAADLAALSGARSLPGEPVTARADARTIAISNGYDDAEITVTTPYEGDPSRIKVAIDSKARLNFMPVLGVDELDVPGAAVAIAGGAAASCTFCSLNPTDKNHTLLLKNGATLRVDGDIIVNSINGGTGPDCTLKPWEVCGDGFDIFGDPPSPPAYISAKSISVAGGWETHDENVVMSDGKIWPDYSTSPPTYRSCPGISPTPVEQTQVSNVCIHVPQIVDPLNNPAVPSAIVPNPASADFVVPDGINCSAGSRYPSALVGNSTPLALSADATICPGLYYGGIEVTAGATTMLPGLYFMSGKNGFIVKGSGSVDGSAGVMIYSSTNTATATVFILPDPDLAKPIDPDRLNPVIHKFESDKNPVVVGGKGVKYTFEIEPAAVPGAPKLNGVVEFYDGDYRITGPAKCQPKTITDKDTRQKVECTIVYGSGDIGTHGISVVFHSSDTCSSSACYNNIEAVLDPVQVVTGGNGSAGDIVLETTGNVQLAGVKAGPYKGIVMFQDRTSDGEIVLSQASGLAACGPTTSVTVAGVTGPQWALQQPPPAPCGALGGIEGTIYAPHQESLVTTTVSGSADIQIIAGKMLINSVATTRFAFDSSKFAGNRVVLIE